MSPSTLDDPGSADFERPLPQHPSSPSTDVPLDDLHPFDLEAIVSQFKGRALISRLNLIYSSCPKLRKRAAALAIPIIKAETFDIPSFDAFGGSKEDPWREEAFNKYTSELEKLETELKSVQANLIKESIRMCNMDLGKLYLKMGDAKQAFKHFSKTRDFNTTSAQNLEMSMNILEVHISSGSYHLLVPHVIKAEAALERPAPTAPTSSVPLSAAQARANAEEAERRKEEKTRITTRLQISKALSSLGQRDYEKAAREFLAVNGDLEDWAYNVISPTEVAVCGSLCALGSLRRSALKSELLLNDAFRTYVDEESYVRDLVDAFVDGKYKECLELLEKHSTRHRLTPFISTHVASLTALIRRRALIQYFQPFQSVKLSRMAAAFGCSDEAVLSDVISLVNSGEIDGRIDLVNKVLSSTKIDSRTSLFSEALKAGKESHASARRVLLRMRLVEENLLVRDPDRKLQSEWQSELLIQGDDVEVEVRS